MAQVVADASSLIHLEKIGQRGLLARQIPRVILDDLSARQFGRSLGLEVVGTGAVLYKAKLMGLIPAVRPLLDALLATGFRLSPKVYRTLLRAAGEAD